VRLQERQHTPKHILAWNPVGQREHLQQKLFFDLGPSGNRRRPTSPRQHCHHGDNDNTDQRMLLIDGRAWIFQLVKVADNLVQANVLDLRHRSSSVSGCKRSHTENGIRTNQRGRKWPKLPRVRAAPGVTVSCLLEWLVAATGSTTLTALIHIQALAFT